MQLTQLMHYKSFVDELYTVYTMSPKNQAELNVIAEALSIELMKVQKIFDVRWVFSSFVAVRAILRDYAALHRYFLESSENTNRNSKERSKYKGLDKKLQTWFF